MFQVAVLGASSPRSAAHSTAPTRGRGQPLREERSQPATPIPRSFAISQPLPLLWQQNCLYRNCFPQLSIPIATGPR